MNVNRSIIREGLGTCSKRKPPEINLERFEPTINWTMYVYYHRSLWELSIRRGGAVVDYVEYCNPTFLKVPVDCCVRVHRWPVSHVCHPSGNVIANANRVRANLTDCPSKPSQCRCPMACWDRVGSMAGNRTQANITLSNMVNGTERWL